MIMNDDKVDFDEKSRSPIDDISSKERERDRSYRGDRPGRFSNVSRDKDRDRSDRGPSAAERRVFVSNIPYEFRWQELKDLFRNEVGEVAYVELFYDEDNKPRGCGIVEFDLVESVAKAVEKMHRYELRDRKLVVKEDFDTVRDKCGRPVKYGAGGGNPGRGNRDDQRRHWDMPQQNQGGGGGPHKWGNTYGLSPQFLESLGINPPLVARVFVANLDYKVDSQKLKEVFKMAGKVLNGEVSLDKEGKSRGFGVVEYDHPVEAVQAISMLNNQMLFERRMAVRMDRADNKLEGPPKLPEGLRGVGMGLGAGGHPLRDVARNLPNITQGPGASIQTGALGLGAGLTNIGLGNAAGLGLAGIGGLGASLLGANLAGAGDLATLANASALAGGLGAGVGALGAGLGVTGSPFGAGVGANPFGVGVGAAPGSAAFLGAGSGAQGPASGYGSNAGPGQAFDSSAMGSTGGGSGGGGGFGGGAAERDLRGGGGQGGGSMGSSYANGPVGGGSSNVTRSDTVLIRNIPQNVTWQMLRDKFLEVGEVKFAELRGKDMGLVRFSSEWDAERAVHMMDRSRFEGRTIEVCLY